ncbi:MAG: tetratricopeptide repeat protein [Betaproteobacteria bacterium]
MAVSRFFLLAFAAIVATPNAIAAEALVVAVRALGWAPGGAELTLVDVLPRPPAPSAAEASAGCQGTEANFDTPGAQAAWQRRRPLRVLTIWGVAHFGTRAAERSGGALCQDRQFLALQWQAALGRPATGKLTEFDVAELSRAISDVEGGRTPSFGALPVGIDPTRPPPPAAAAKAGPGAAESAPSKRDPVDPSAALGAMSGAEAEAFCRSPASPREIIRRCALALQSGKLDEGQTARSLFTMAGAHEDLNDLRIAEALYTKGIVLVPTSYVGYLLRAEVYRKLGILDLAFLDFDKVLEIGHPASLYDAYTGRGITYGMARQDAKALADFDRAMAIDPADPRARQNREVLLARRRGAR